MSDNNKFEDIVGGMDDGNDGGHMSLWDAVVASYSKSHGVLVKGLIIVETADGTGKALRFMTSDGLTPWDAKGMLRDVLDQFSSEGTVEMLLEGGYQGDDNDDDE